MEGAAKLLVLCSDRLLTPVKDQPRFVGVPPVRQVIVRAQVWLLCRGFPGLQHGLHSPRLTWTAELVHI